MIIPHLRQDLEILRGNSREDGSPAWLLYDAIRNKYFTLGITAFRLIKNWTGGVELKDFEKKINSEGIETNIDEIKSFVNFLQLNNLIVQPLGQGVNLLSQQKNSLKKSKILITPTQSSKNDIANLFSFEKKRIEVIWNGINIKKVEPFKPKKFTSRLVSIISSDVPMKNLEIVLKSLKDLSDQGINIKLKIIGDLREKNNNLIKQLEIADKIEFLPKLSKDQLIQNLDDADIGICPSIYEGFGFPLVEMMSRGLPVIASNRGSLPELLSDAGLTFNPFDKDELTVKIKQMLENTKLREKFALNSLNRMDDFFDWDEYAMKLEPLYQKILSGHF